MRKYKVLLVVAALLLFPLLLEAKVTEIVVTNVQSPTFGGSSFGSVGQYERIDGIFKCEIDPQDPLNADIVNIDKAPRNSRGKVEYDMDFFILKPIDMNKGNGHLLFDTPNRGGPATLGSFNNGARSNRPSTAADAGNGFLMKLGYTILSSGWQVSYPIPGLTSFLVGLGSRIPIPATGIPPLLARFPIAKNADGTSVVGTSRELWASPDTAASTSPFTGYLTYPAANLDPTQATLTVRERASDPRQPMPASSWRYLDEYRVEVTRSTNSQFDMGAIYEFIYPAKDPIVYGLGFASIRDGVSFLRYGLADDKGNSNPLAPGGVPTIQKALAFGLSQTGRIVKTLVTEGFNQDEKGRIVFDGINSHIGGGRRNWLNGELSHPGDIFGDDQFPFGYRRLYPDVA